METPLTCDRCGEELESEDGESVVTVSEAGDNIEEDAYFIAVREAEVEEETIRVIEADVYCEDHTPDTAYEYE